MPWRQQPCPGDSGRALETAAAVQQRSGLCFISQALGATPLIRGLGSPSECRVGGRPSTSRDSWVGHRRDASGERARRPPHLRSSKRKPMLGSFSGILLRVVILTCILPPDPPPHPARPSLWAALLAVSPVLSLPCFRFWQFPE